MNTLLRQTISVRITLFIFLIVAVLGVFLRYAFAYDLPDFIDYRKITHAHSHLAILGWIYSGLYILIIRVFNLDQRKYYWLLWCTLLLVSGMLISFPIEGYGPFSIALNVLHIILSYVFIIFIFRDLKLKVLSDKYAGLFLKTALILLFISTLGTWALGIIMNSGYRGSPVYFGAIQFFLHFQFNGWFVFGAIAIFLQFISQIGINVSEALIKKLYYTLLISCILTFALAISWSTPDIFIFLTNSIGVTIQLAALLFLIRVVNQISPRLREQISHIQYLLLTCAIMCLYFKIFIQGFVAIPALANISYTIKNFIIGFIHLLNLGFVSSFLLGMLYYFLKFRMSLFKYGIIFFLLGFVGSECLLFIQGLLLWVAKGFIPFYYEIIFYVSLLLPLGVGLVTWSLQKIR